MSHLFTTNFKPDGNPYTFCSHCGETKEFLSNPALFVDGVPPRCLFVAPVAAARTDPAPAGGGDFEQVITALQRLSLQFASIANVNSPVTGSDAHHGAAIVQEMKSADAYLEVAATDGPAVLTSNIVLEGKQLVNSGVKEDYLVALYTPSFQNILDEVNCIKQSRLQLVNSECYTWLRALLSDPKKDAKPDLFITSHENVQYKPAYSKAPVCQSNRSFGKFPVWRCRDSLNSIWEAKTKLDDEGKGKVFRYMQIAGQDCKNHDNCVVAMRGVAFDAESMILITGLRERIVHISVLRMDAAGSRKYLINFLCAAHDDWAAAVEKSCAELKVTLGIIDVGSSNKSQILLGAGGNGRAYRLTEDGALKVSVGRRMEREHAQMLAAHERCPELVVKPLQYYEQLGEDGKVQFSAYTMEECGQAVTRPFSSDKLKSLATALHGLHKAGVIHGDPRVENIVSVGSALKWIDFYDSFISLGTNFTMQEDVKTFVRSVCGDDRLISPEALSSYAENCTIDALMSLMG